MQKELRFKIISEGLKNGVSDTCRKYDISRTIYYRWLKRYKTQGIDGLDDKKKHFIPPNKTKTEVENSILNLIKTYPNYGPRALKYLLDELGYDISESAVYNVLKRNNLTGKSSRIKFAKKGEPPITRSIPTLSELKSGECWIFWITEYGHDKNLGHVYAYNLFDLKSHVACTRLYNKVSFSNFEDLLTAVALSVATSLNLKINYICLFEDRKILKHADNVSRSKIHKTLQNHGYDPKIHFLKEHEDMDEIIRLKALYIEESISFIMPLINEGLSFSELKLQFQDYIRKYNISNKKQYADDWYSPIEYHNKCTNTKLILPIWAYMDRNY